MQIRFFLSALFSLYCVFSSAQNPNALRNYRGKTTIKSVAMFQKGFELQPPFFPLGGSNPLLLMFDDLEAQIKDYQYTVIHCNAKWEPSSLLPQEYITGFIEDFVSNYAFSFNTLQSYVHYELELPNANMSFKKSGNYIVKVFELGKPENPVLLQRFVVYEGAVTLGGVVKRSDMVQERERLQEIDFNVLLSFPILSPFTEVKANIMQNYRWDNVIENVAPTFVRENELVYNYDTKTSFPAGNEYRYLDLKSLRARSERVAAITSDQKLYEVKVVAERLRGKLPYSTYEDINGAFVVRNDDGPNRPNTDADYAWVTFTMPFEKALAGGSFYLNGSFTSGILNDEFRLNYNYDIGAYQCKTLMKQGYYNYQIVFVDNVGKVTSTLTEGDFFQTENTYTIIVYYRDFSSDYDRVIAIQNLNSVKRY